MTLDYETLRVIWWALLGVLLIGFAIMDGFDMGVAIMLPWVAKTDEERRILINAIGPTWEGNQVWFILGGGAIFAAWPSLYALSFSGFYLAMLLVLLALILRPVGFKYRSKLAASTWRQFWDYALFIGGLVPALIFGVAVGNVLQGVPFYFDETLRPYYTGQFLALLNPFALYCGLLSVLMLSMQGAQFLGIKTEGVLKKRSKKWAQVTSVVCLFLFACGAVFLNHTHGYQLTHDISHIGPSNPLHKSVDLVLGAWLNNYRLYPLLWLVPALGLTGALLSVFCRGIIGFMASSASILGIIGSVGISMFPFILPSSSHPSQSLMVWDSSSSQNTLEIMLIATIIFLPIVLTYTAWIYRIMRGPVNGQTIAAHEESAY
jgi:cytochrome bd ubiquinol oxidase subunit II